MVDGDACAGDADAAVVFAFLLVLLWLLLLLRDHMDACHHQHHNAPDYEFPVAAAIIAALNSQRHGLQQNVTK